MNLSQLMKMYSTPAKCKSLLKRLRWPNGVHCPRCGHDKTHYLKNQEKYECADYHYQFSVTAGTIFHKTHISLRKWFITIYMTCASKKGMSAHQIHRMLGISYPTAWCMCHRIRTAMVESNYKLFGTLEMDDTYVGGKSHGKRGRPGPESNKTPVIGVIERGGNIICKKVPNMKKDQVKEFVKQVVDKDAIEVIYIDEFKSYRIFSSKIRHEIINHKITYVEGDIHTNSVENFWSLLKRGIMGAFHQISRKHLSRYLGEFMWRFNNHNCGDLFKLLLFSSEQEHMQFAELAG